MRSPPGSEPRALARGPAPPLARNARSSTPGPGDAGNDNPKIQACRRTSLKCYVLLPLAERMTPSQVVPAVARPLFCGIVPAHLVEILPLIGLGSIAEVDIRRRSSVGLERGIHKPEVPGSSPGAAS